MNLSIMSQNTLTISGTSYPVYPRPALPAWIETAETKGFDLVCRIADRLHLALRCRKCGALNKVKRFTLMDDTPLCHACIEAEWRSDATIAGVEFLRRDVDNRHYAFYRTPCGHELRRQTGMIKRVAGGKTDLRCETCHAAMEAAEAEARGWRLLGPDPDGNANYRVYRHDPCGQEQRIARINMITGRCECARCGNGWTTEKSYLYAMSFVLPNSRELVKLGFSRDPESRLIHQLRRSSEMPCEILTSVPVATGNDAIRVEKKLHARLRREHPEAIVDPQSYSAHIRVRSEIYDAALTPVILEMLGDLAQGSDIAA